MNLCLYHNTVRAFVETDTEPPVDLLVALAAVEEVCVDAGRRSCRVGR